MIFIQRIVHVIGEVGSDSAVIMLKSDQEPAMISLQKEIRKELWNEVNEIAGKMNKKFEKIIHKNKLFSYPFGKISDISENSYKIANKKYKFIFLGIRGENKVSNIKQKLIFF